MNMVHLRCPDCGADLEVDNSREFCFCQYCGTKIILEDQSASIRRTKARLKTIDKFLDQREAQQIRKMEDRRLREEAKREERRQREEKERKDFKQFVIGFVIFFFVCIGLIMLMGVIGVADYSTTSKDTDHSDTVQSECLTPTETHHHSELHYEYHELLLSDTQDPAESLTVQQCPSR